MVYPSWQSSKNISKTYCQRKVWASSLYRIVYHYREEFEYKYSDIFQQNYGFLRKEVLDAFDKFLNCGVLRHGAAKAQCAKCSHSILIPFSCKRRGICPSCQAKRSIIFAENLNSNILINQSHLHLVFTIPKRLRVYFQFDRSLFKYLYKAAWETWKEYCEELSVSGKTGAVMSLHTSGDLLHWHPHIHMISLNGTIDQNDSFKELTQVDTEKLKLNFGNKLFAALLKEELISEETISDMKSWKHSGFSIYAAPKILPDDENARLFLARYLKKAPFAESRLSLDESGLEPTALYSKTLEDGSKETRAFSPLQLLAEISLHIPKVYEQTTRMFGIYSSSYRGKKAKQERFKNLISNNFQPLEEREQERPKSSSFARCMKLVFEIDPLECPKCGDNMKIVAFIQNPKEIKKIAENLKYTTWSAPPDFSYKQGIHYADTF